MKLRGIQIYVGSMVALALGAVGLQVWHILPSWLPLSSPLPWREIGGWIALVALGLLSESLTLPIKVGKTAKSTSSIIFLPLLASVLLFGPFPTVLLFAVTGVAGEFLIRKKETIKAVFNSSQYVFSTSVAGWVFTELGGRPLALAGQEVGVALAAFFAYGFVFLLLNHAAVSLAITLNEGGKIRRVWALLAGRTGTNLFYDILVSPIAIAMAFLYMQLWIVGLFLIVLPLLFIRYAYQTILQLQQANRDLLTVLVKAIETRDPYTSGHSLRVASLAVRIAEAMDFPITKQGDVETAALLHDIGKIEAIYTEILRKPDNLTPEEREIIESHVTKGVELLEQLSSFSKNVIAGVRGHHERVDGKGYPLGLKGNQIPVEAKIIKVCDAIDAMLSDRPYRKALLLAQVKEQLVIYSGVQFDLEVVKAAIDGDVLEAHQAEIELQKHQESLHQDHVEPQQPARALALTVP